MGKIPPIPGVPVENVSLNLRTFLSAVKTTLDYREGRLTDKSGKFITMADIQRELSGIIKPHVEKAIVQDQGDGSDKINLNDLDGDGVLEIGSQAKLIITADRGVVISGRQGLMVTGGGSIDINTGKEGRGLVVGDWSGGEGWQMNNTGLFSYTANFPLHGFANTSNIPWQRHTESGVSPIDSNFVMNAGDVVLGAYNYKVTTTGDAVGGVFWNNSTKELKVRGAILEESLIGYDQITDGPPIDADNTANNQQSWSWIAGQKPDINADKTSTAFYSQALTKNSGDITIKDGADIIMDGNGSDTSRFVFKPVINTESTHCCIEGAYSDSMGHLNIAPITTDHGMLHFGTWAGAIKWNSIYGYATSIISFKVDDNNYINITDSYTRINGTNITLSGNEVHVSNELSVSNKVSFGGENKYFHKINNDIYWYNGTTDTKLNDQGGSGSLESLTPGTGLSGSAYDGSTARTFAVSYGTAAGTACQGNDSRLSDARTPTSHALSFHSDCAGTTASRSNSSTTYLLQAKAMYDHRAGDDHSSTYAPYSHMSTVGSTSVYGHLKLGTTAGTAAQGDHTHSGYASSSDSRFLTDTQKTDLTNGGHTSLHNHQSLMYDGDLKIYATSSNIYSYENFKPISANSYYLGDSSRYWKYVYAYKFYWRADPGGGSFDVYDDLDVIDNAKLLKDKDGKNKKDKHGIPIYDALSLPDTLTNMHDLAKKYNTTTDALRNMVDTETTLDVEFDDEDKNEKKIRRTKTLDQATLRDEIFYNVPSMVWFGIGATKQLNREVTEDVVEQFNSIIESLISRVNALERKVQ